jgi:hypothetical protein
MKGRNWLFLICTPFLSGPAAQKTGEDFCSVKNTTTQNGEEINYTVFYSLAGIYANAGWAKFTNTLEKLNGKPVYHVMGSGASNTSYDWFYKVRDTYESFIDTNTMRPLKFMRNVEDGGKKKYESVSFNQESGSALTEKGTVKVPSCIQDVLSTIYYARNINFQNYKAGDKIPFRMFLENEVHELYIRYLGKEDLKTKYGKFKTIKFRPLLVAGTLFSGGENMMVWVSDDANHLPLRIESPILVGSIKVDMVSYKNLRYPLAGMKKPKK